MRLRIFQAGGAESFEIVASANQKLSEAIWLADKAAPNSLCGGLARCGRCLARFLQDAPTPTQTEKECLTQAQLADGWRLCCCHKCDSQIPLAELELPAQSPFLWRKEEILAPANSSQAFLGIDLGTTSLQWRAEDLAGNCLAQGSLPNPQAAVGADIVARIACALAPDGLARLSRLATTQIQSITDRLKEAGLSPGRLCVAGNSAMTAILLQKNVSGLASAPWLLDYEGGEIIAFHGQEMVIPPLFSPFVGGDISSGLLALLRAGAPRPFLLADLGTNGEIAIVDEKLRLHLASVPLGPALEGIGPECGLPAGENVITSFAMSAKGLTKVGFGEAQPVGISATGYISLIAILKRFGVLDSAGHFIKNPAMPLGASLAANIRLHDKGEVLQLTDKLYLSAHDVELLLKVKAAFSTALGLLLRASGIAAKSIRRVYVAGALGSHANMADLAELGFFPKSMSNRITVAGNTSLAGACILARQPQKMKILLKMRTNATILQLAEDSQFLRDYLAAMIWDWNVV